MLWSPLRSLAKNSTDYPRAAESDTLIAHRTSRTPIIAVLLLGSFLPPLDFYIEPEQAGLAAGVVTSILQVGAAVGVAAVGSVFFTVLGQQSNPSAYGNAFASAVAIAACLQVLGMLLATKMNHRRRSPAVAAQVVVAQDSE